MNLSLPFPLKSLVAFLLTTPWLACAASSVTLISSPNPATYGPPVTLDATVSPALATGQVTFYERHRHIGDCAGGDGRTDAAALNYFDNSLTILLAQAPPPQPPSLSVTKLHLGNFTFGQANAKYTVTVSNAAGAGQTNGTVLVTDNLPAGLTATDMSGTGWSCKGNTCSRADRFGAGQSYPPIIVTATVSPAAGSTLTNQVTLSGGGSSGAAASDTATITQMSTCDLDQDGHTNAADIQSIVMRALGVQSILDLNHDGVVNVADIQLD